MSSEEPVDVKCPKCNSKNVIATGYSHGVGSFGASNLPPISSHGQQCKDCGHLFGQSKPAPKN